MPKSRRAYQVQIDFDTVRWDDAGLVPSFDIGINT